jgi:hypothetical protein
LNEKPELSDGQIISDFSVNVLLYNDSGATLSLDNYIEELEEQGSFKTSLNDEEIKPLATGGIVWVNSINGNLNTRNIEITTKYVSYVGSKPDSVSFTNKFLASDVQTSNKGYYAEKGRDSKHLTRNQSFTSTLRSQTKYWIGSNEVKVFEKGVPVGLQTGDTDRILYNNAAMPYFKYVDSLSGLVNYEPSYTIWKNVPNPTPWDSSKDRGAYITYYINTYGNPGWDWASYDIHHIKPREYGGGNEKSNLIPVPRSIHQQLITAWWNSYNKG